MSDLEPLRGGWFQGWQGCPQALGTLTVSVPVDPPSLPMLTPGVWGPASGGLALPLPILLICLCKFEVNIPWTVPLGYLQN